MNLLGKLICGSFCMYAERLQQMLTDTVANHQAVQHAGKSQAENAAPHKQPGASGANTDVKAR